MRNVDRRFGRFALSALIAALLLLALLPASAQQKSTLEELDTLAPKSDPADALTLQLHTATLISNSLEETLLFYRDGMGMRARGPFAPPRAMRKVQRRLWGMPKDVDWQLWLLDRPAVPGLMQIRLLVPNKPAPAVHQSWNSAEEGPFSLGFPNGRQRLLDAEIRRLGFGSQAPLSEYQVPRADGVMYDIRETIFNCPDFLHCVGIERSADMPPLGPLDDATAMGGPAYSAQVLDDADRDLSFYTEVLGMELRADRQWTTSGALGVPSGTDYRFALVYAQGARFGHLLFVDYLNHPSIPPQNPPRPPHRGLVMWSFPTRDLDAVLRRARRHPYTQVHHGPVVYESLSLGRHRVATLLAPNGFMVEVFEPLPAGR